jgi:hypothetical protein
MSITTIARQAQGMRAGQVIAKLAEDAYFVRVDNRVAQPPPARNRDNEATSRNADLGRNRTQGELPASPTVLMQMPADPLKLATVLQLLAAIARSSPIANLAAAAATAEAPTMEPTGGPVAEAIAMAEATRIATPPEPHRAASTPPEDRRTAGKKVCHCRRQRRLPRLLSSASQLTSPGQVQTSGNH